MLKKAFSLFAILQISGGKIAANSITTVHIQNGAVTNAKIAKNSVNGTQIQYGTIEGSDINSSTTININGVKIGGTLGTAMWNSHIPRANTITTVDTAGESQTSITIGTDGLPIVSYLDNTNYVLRIFHAGSILGFSNWTRR